METEEVEVVVEEAKVATEVEGAVTEATGVVRLMSSARKFLRSLTKLSVPRCGLPSYKILSGAPWQRKVARASSWEEAEASCASHGELPRCSGGAPGCVGAACAVTVAS